GNARARTCLGFRAQPLPERCIMAAPAEKAKVVTRESRGAIGSDQRRLDAERPRAAQGIQELRRRRVPTRTQQHTGCDVLLEGCLARRRAIATAVQTLPGQIDRQRDLPAPPPPIPPP